MKMAVLSNINLEPLKSHFAKIDIKNTMYFSGYNQYMFELLDKNSMIYQENFDTIFIHLDGEELLKDDFFSLSDKNDVLKYFDEILSAITGFLEHKKDINIIISTILLPPFSFLTYLDINSKYSFTDLFNKINKKILNTSRIYSNLLVMDFERLLKLYGYNFFYDDKYWYLGRIKYTNMCFEILSKEIYNLISAFKGKTKKVIVLDLDNTLWGGIIGEDGLNGIKLSEDGVGKIYRDFQKIIKSLKEIGILLTINSKNNDTDVKEVFQNHPMMILKYEDFIIKKINWNNKVSNMIDIARELNLGLDSFVFIDDNPVERELVRENLREVTVPDFPEDVSLLKRWFLSEVIYNCFPKISLTEEDKEKSLQYKRKIERDEIKSSLNLEDFINALNIKLKVIRNSENIKTRLAQLSQKTNQFNLTAKRYTEKDVERFIEDNNIDIYGLNYEDKFGNEGIIGLAILKLGHKIAGIDTFLLSCRVIGRTIEYSFLYEIVKNLKKMGFYKVQAEYIPTNKNVIVRDFYDSCGCERTGDGYEGTVNKVLEILSKKKIIREVSCNG